MPAKRDFTSAFHEMRKPQPKTAEFYFAYGSNLHKGQMKLRCPSAKPLGVMGLRDWRLVFRGVADIIPAEGFAVDGAIWRITDKCEQALDRYEGVSSGLYRKEYFDVSVNGEKGRALVYLMNADHIAPPGRYYFDTIKEGFENFGLECESLSLALEHSKRNRCGHEVPSRSTRETQRA